VQAYLDIERARLGSRLRMTVDVEPALMSCVLPAFILQPLVENAITHGIARRPDGGEISLQTRCDGDDLVIDISNTCAPESAEPEPGDGAQMTIPNSRRRLALMHGAAARLDAGFVGRNLFRASIILPRNSSAVPKPA